MKVIYKLIRASLIGLSLSFLACSASLRSNIEIPPVIVANKAPEGRPAAPVDSMVYIDAFLDARANEAIAIEDGREVRAANDLSALVVTALEGALRGKGFTFTDTAPVVLSGEIREWVAVIEGGISKEIRGTSEVFVEVRDPADKRVYSGLYKGFAARRKAGYSERDVQEVIRTSMAEALSQVLNDQQLMKLLSSF